MLLMLTKVQCTRKQEHMVASALTLNNKTMKNKPNNASLQHHVFFQETFPKYSDFYITVILP